MTQSCRATFLFIVACGGAKSGAPWWPWDVGGRHGWWVHGLASFIYGTLGVFINILSTRIPSILLVETGTKSFASGIMDKETHHN
jgi:hypothetical protein